MLFLLFYQKIFFILQYKCLSMLLKKSRGQQQNAIGVTFHSPIVIILTFDTLGSHIFSIFAHEFRSSWLASVRLAVYTQ